MAHPAADVMISYAAADTDFVLKLADGLRKHGISVWYPELGAAGVKSITERADAVVKCKIFMLILSEASAQDRLCKDELALSYISNTPMYPIGLKFFKKIEPHLDSGMRLMLAKINWLFFAKPEKYTESLSELCEALKHTLSRVVETQGDGGDNDDEDETYDKPFNIHMLEKDGTKSIHDGSAPDDPQDDLEPEEPADLTPNVDFWDRHFGQSEEVKWTDFKDKLLGDYEERIKRSFGEEKIKFFSDMIHKDVFHCNRMATKKTYKRFVGDSGGSDPHLFYSRLEKYAIGSLAMREVFNMDSSVRLSAIQNLGGFRTPAVMKALFDLIKDQDPNVRAVAALALAKTGSKSKRIIDALIGLTEDEDRLVRESACLSLGHMRCGQAVTYIVDRWRNDPIKHVREAAELALSRMGGKEAEQAMKVTGVLAHEMEEIRKMKRAEQDRK